MNWQWIAGFFEGEGSIQWKPGKPGTRQGRGAAIIIGQKDKRPLQEIQRFLKAHGFMNPRLYLRPAVPPKKPNPIWILVMYRREDTTRFLRTVGPVLIQKRERATEVLLLLRDIRSRTEPLNLKHIQALRRRGLSWEKIRSRLKVSYTKLSRALRLARIPMLPRVNQFIDWERVTILRERGLTWRQIADQTGYKRPTLKEYNRRGRRNRTRTGLP